jgi:hypothetical protein
MFKRVMAVAGVALLVSALGLFAAGAVSAEEPAPRVLARGPWGHIGGGIGCVGDAAAGLLGMTREEISSERCSGKTLAEIAREMGMSDQQMIDALLASRKEAVQRALESGRLTQDQADRMLERLEATVSSALSRPSTPRGRGWSERGTYRCWQHLAPEVPAQPGS